ncbi:MAG: twin-arginine translocase subunit TatC [Candidatus Sumerlaeaceae bacterium]|nr:twin-arginine translocase subunit TatC [Candidatus Sumerlaeaceae bacterium]
MIDHHRPNPRRVLSFTEHLEELRMRIIICCVVLVLSFLLGLYFSPTALAFLMRPLSNLPVAPSETTLALRLEPDGALRLDPQAEKSGDAASTAVATLAQPASRLVITDHAGRPLAQIGPRDASHLFFLSPVEPFVLILKGALLVSAVVTVPVTVYQLWLFIAPGLLVRERRIVRPIIAASMALFPSGAIFAYFVSSVALKVLLSFGQQIPGLEPSLVASKYLSFILTLMLVFGVVFEFPLVLLMLSRFGVIDAAFLSDKRRYAIVVMSIVAAVATPTPDPFTMLAMLLPLLALYEVSILLVRALEKAAGPGTTTN